MPRLFDVMPRLFDVMPRLFDVMPRLFDVMPRLFDVMRQRICHSTTVLAQQLFKILLPFKSIIFAHVYEKYSTQECVLR